MEKENISCERNLEWERTFDAIDDWISIITPDSVILRSNRGGEKLLGMRVQEIVGKKCCFLAHGTDATIEGCPLHTMQTTRKRESAEVQILDGRWMLITVDPLFDDSGNMTGAVHIARDITRRITVQNEREKLVRELRHALDNVKTLSGLLPICSICKRIRDDQGYWNQIEQFISKRSGVDFSHSLCPDCVQKHYPDFHIKIQESKS